MWESKQNKNQSQFYHPEITTDPSKPFPICEYFLPKKWNQTPYPSL